MAKGPRGMISTGFEEHQEVDEEQAGEACVIIGGEDEMISV